MKRQSFGLPFLFSCDLFSRRKPYLLSMKKLSYLFTFAMVLIFCSSQAQNIDESKSVVQFEISNMKFKTIEGTFKGMKGNVRFDPNQLDQASIEVCLDAASVDTENEKRDEHLRKEDFFHTSKFPSICFSSSNVMKKDNAYIATGTLSLHGIIKEVAITFNEIPNGLVGSFSINRLDFAVGEETGTFMVGNEVLLKITCFLTP